MALSGVVALATVAFANPSVAAQEAPTPSPEPAAPDPSAAAPPAAVAPVPAPPTTPVLDEAALATLVALRREASIATTSAAAETAAAVARTTVAAAQVRLELASASIAPAEVAVEEASGTLDDARDELESIQAKMADLLSESFQLSSTSADALASDPLSALESSDRFAQRYNSAAFSEVAFKSVRAWLEGARGDVRSAEAAHVESLKTLASAQAELVAATASVGIAEADLQRVVADGAAAVERARTSGEVESVGADGPSIMGPSVVGATDMAAFVQARGRPHPSIDMVELARTFLVEGDLEGVRGDVAFVQSILETGWFSYESSMVDPEDHNYAGIGACDSCSDGFGYPSVELGVRAQIQLLAAYAQPGITSADYARPAVRTIPERLGVRGCCGTWMALSGVWATGPGYGTKILELYNELLAFAVARSATAVG
jgi:hypothetical protein